MPVQNDVFKGILTANEEFKDVYYDATCNVLSAVVWNGAGEWQPVAPTHG